MRLVSAAIALVAVSFSFWTNAQAEVIDLEGTVKAVDAESRIISIERKTPKGTKTLELEVTKKGGDLGGVKAGDSIPFSYDPDLEVVTKFSGGDGKSEKASDTGRIVRVRYHFAADGSCKLETVRLNSKAEPIVGGCRKEDKGNGVWQITETFEDEDSLARFSGPISELTNVSYSAEQKALTLSPKAGGKPTAVLLYPMRCRLPLSIEVDIRTAEKHGHFQINPNAVMPPNIHPFANVFTHDGGSKLDLSCSWVVSRDAKKGEPTIEEVFGERGVSTSQPFSKEARSPVGVDPEMIYFVRLGAFGAGPDSSTVYISRLSVTARFAPTLGVALKQDGDRVLAASVNNGSPAERSGIKAGDYVLSIDGKSPSTMQRAVSLLSMTNYGESWNLEVERDGQKKTFTIKAE